jgi:hypothetical protein
MKCNSTDWVIFYFGETKQTQYSRTHTNTHTHTHTHTTHARTRAHTHTLSAVSTGSVQPANIGCPPYPWTVRLLVRLP